MTRKKSGAGLGNSLTNDRRKRAEQGYKASGVAEDKAHRSVLEQTSLDDFIAKAENLASNRSPVFGHSVMLRLSD